MNYGVRWRFAPSITKKVFKDDKTKQEIEQPFREITLHYDMEVGEKEVLFDHLHLSLAAPPNLQGWFLQRLQRY